MDIKGFKNLTKSLSLYHRITDEKLFTLDENEFSLENLYTDLLPNNGILDLTLEKCTTFLVGRKGTGKSTIFARAQYDIHKEKNALSVYINAKSIYKECEINDFEISSLGLVNCLTEDEQFKLSLIKRIINSLITGLIKELKKENNGWFEGVRNHFRHKKIEKLVKELEELLDSEKYQNISKVYLDEVAVTENEQVVAKVHASLKDLNCSTELSMKEESELSVKNINILARIFDIGEIINKFLEILRICSRDCMYIFVDDYSELELSQRSIFMNTIISPMYHLGVDKIYFKIACYPNKIEPIKLDSGKYIIKNIDLYDIYGKDNNIPTTEKLAIGYVKRMIESRIKIYCKDSIEKYLDTRNVSIEDYYKVLYQMSIAVPRVLGHILHSSYLKSITMGKPITMAVLNQASKEYYNEHVEINFRKQSNIKYEHEESKVEILVLENIKNSLVEIAQKNKYQLPKERDNTFFEGLSEAPTSHFTISPNYEMYIEELEFNGFIHKINKLAAKGRTAVSYKNETNFLYALDYGLCLEEKIDYGKPEQIGTKYFQQRCFVYDDIILSVLQENKKIVCKDCGAEYPIDLLDKFEWAKMRCINCPDGTCSVEINNLLFEQEPRNIQEVLWSDQEFDILYAILMLKLKEEDEPITANLISREVDYSSYVIGRKCRELAIQGFVEREKYFKADIYVYDLTDRSEQILEKIIKK